MTDTPDTPAPIKRPRGRPRKTTTEREPMRESTRSETAATRYKMRANPNWETVDPMAENTPDRLKIPPHLIPDGLVAQWVTDSVYGQPVPQHRAEFERGGWTPVHQDDFDGQFDGMFMPKGKQGEILVDGLVLCVRPKELNARAKRKNDRMAREQVAIKEAALRGGDLPGVSLDPSHPSAVRFNQVNKSLAQVVIEPDRE